jgi:hypothetical protein
MAQWFSNGAGGLDIPEPRETVVPTRQKESPIRAEGEGQNSEPDRLTDRPVVFDIPETRHGVIGCNRDDLGVGENTALSTSLFLTIGEPSGRPVDASQILAVRS